MAATASMSGDPRSLRRGAGTPEPIAAQTVRWLASLPEDIRPQQLPESFTHVANKLGHVWEQPETCLAYFDDLLLDRRGGRRGFPLDVAMELAGLKNHYETVVRQVPQTVWELIIDRYHS